MSGETRIMVDRLFEIDDNQPYFWGYNGYNPSNVDNRTFRMGDNSSELGNNLFKMLKLLQSGTSSIKLTT